LTRREFPGSRGQEKDLLSYEKSRLQVLITLNKFLKKKLLPTTPSFSTWLRSFPITFFNYATRHLFFIRALMKS